MRLAKQALDVGQFTNRRDEQLAFWQHTVGLDYDELAKLGGGVQQHRHHAGRSIVKVNHARDPLPELSASGIAGLRIARDDIAQPQSLADPDGNRVELVPRGHDGVDGIGVLLRVNDADVHDAFWTEVMEYERAGDHRYRCGESLVEIAEEGRVEERDGWQGPGFRYTTVQVWDCEAEYHDVLARGARGGMPPKVLGGSVRFAFVLDPDGNHIEISQKASLTGGSL